MWTLASVLARYTVLPLLTKLGIWGAVALIVGAAYFGWKYKIYREGYAAAIADIAAENKEATDEANRLKAIRRACTGDWDQSRGVCLNK